MLETTRGNSLSLAAGPLIWVRNGNNAMFPTTCGGLVNWEWYACKHQTRPSICPTVQMCTELIHTGGQVVPGSNMSGMVCRAW